MKPGNDARVQAVLLCAGKSERMGSDKMRVVIGGKPVWQRSLDMLLHLSELERVIVVASGAVKEAAKGYVGDRVRFADGGETRQQSVYNGLLEAQGAEIVVIHDAARCLCDEALVRECICAARDYGSGVAGVEATDTLKKMCDGFAVATLDRESVFQAQTPQVFQYKLIREAYDAAERDGVTATDDAMLLERLGHKVRMVKALSPNFKITVASDVRLARGLIGTTRVGYGEDAHRLQEGRKLILGGVHIPYTKGLMGHSDADALTHAVIDALLGAAALGDIGRHFPETEENRDSSSLLLLEKVNAMLHENGFSPVNIDATVIAQAPRLAGYIEAMRANLAGVLALPVENISVKATTTEGMGFEGRLEGVSARAVALISC